MAITNLDAAKFGLLVMYAENMYVEGQRIPRGVAPGPTMSCPYSGCAPADVLAVITR